MAIGAQSPIQKPRLPPLSGQSIDYYVKQTTQYDLINFFGAHLTMRRLKLRLSTAQ